MTVPISRQVARGGSKSMLEATIRIPNNGQLTNSELVGCSISDPGASPDRIFSDGYTWTSEVPAELKAGQYVSVVRFLFLHTHTYYQLMRHEMCALFAILHDLSFLCLSLVSPSTLKRPSSIPVARVLPDCFGRKVLVLMVP